MSKALPLAPEHTGIVTAEPIFKAEPRLLPDTFTVDVTDEDVLLGRRRDATGCPIARALTRTLVLGGYDNEPDVCVGGKQATWGMDRQRYSHDGRTFILAFDSYQAVEPCRVTFTRVR